MEGRGQGHVEGGARGKRLKSALLEILPLILM